MAGKSPRHLVWEWNGTVLNDFDVSIRSTNSSFRDAGLPEISTATYRPLLRTPVRSFYAAVPGRDPTDEECDVLGRAFHTYYLLYEKEAALSPGLPHPFRKWHGAGHTPSLLSLHPHESWSRPSHLLISERVVIGRWSRPCPAGTTATSPTATTAPATTWPPPSRWAFRSAASRNPCCRTLRSTRMRRLLQPRPITCLTSGRCGLGARPPSNPSTVTPPS